MVRRACSIFALLLVSSGCDFFKELQSEPLDETGTDSESGSETDGTGGTDETAAGPCTVLDDHCANQDTLYTCDANTGEVMMYDCGVLCGSELLNFTCIPTDSFAHACWCVQPGDIKLRSCSELEACVNECGDPNSDCSKGCFVDTDATTIRLLGTLWSCADLACDEICADYPAECSGCLASARAGLWGDCGVERSVCDADQTDEPTWP